MEETELIVKIKQEKVTPERDVTRDDIEKILDNNLFGESEQKDDKKEIEPTKTSDQLLEELFGVFGANVNIPDILSSSVKEKKSKKKKKRKHDDSDGESTSSKHKKAKKAKKVKKEKKSDDEDVKKAIKKEKKEKKDAKNEEPGSVKEVTERRKLSIVIKDSKFRSKIVKPSTSKSSSSKDKEREKEKEKEKEKKEKRRKSKEREKQKEKERKSREKKSSGDISDVSLSDEETYRKMLEYHTSSRWVDDRSNHVREWDRDKYRRGRSRDDDRQARQYRPPRSRSRSRSKHSPIDKKKLLEIARKNAISMLKSGTLPRNISDNAKEKLITKIRTGGKTIEELTSYCKKLSKAEDLGELSELSDSDNDGDGKPRAFHHPFEVKDRGPIVMNIRNSVPIAPKQASELKAIMSQFPVSSGKQHQKVENTWVPVTTSSTPTTVTTVATISKPILTLERQIQEQLPELAKPKPLPLEPPPSLHPALMKPYDWKSDDHYLSKTIVPELAPPPQPPVDVSDIISQRLNAMRKLQENPNDFEASKILHETQQNMSQWAQSKYTPGQFLGSTEVRVLSQKELATGSQAWARKNQLIDSKPVSSGMGMHLLKKMGWSPGEGLGKESNGSLTPLLLELKLDKRGLEANEEVLRQKKGAPMLKGRKGGPRGVNGANAPMPMANLEQKHPVSLLGELSAKRKWGAPNYTLVMEEGPAHAKNFIFKVRLNGIDYTSPVSSNNKKEAKSAVAKFCLQQLGILPP